MNLVLPVLYTLIKKGRRRFLRGGARAPTGEMIIFIDEYKMCWGVEPMCRVLPIALSTLALGREVTQSPDEFAQ